ncbi:hypothetical protein K7W03_20475 [Sphingobium sp. PNB]|uniref:hypothetical protein n=1 Tax=Sphingobium sp. PNB TaxID=863934 RepID=UPI001CA425A4|nr:hypothetical protein [Sphingobium sp. PNB]MCB4861971.1 hypothetical protein [Sphingobium sp. PNB]
MKQFNNDIRNLSRKMHSAIEQQNEKSARQFEQTIRRNAPKSDEAPHIVDTIQRYDGDAATAEKVVSIGNDQLPYGAALEFGHTLNGKWVEGKKFWTPAKKIAHRKHRRALARTIRKLLREALGI